MCSEQCAFCSEVEWCELDSLSLGKYEEKKRRDSRGRERKEVFIDVEDGSGVG